MAAPSNYDFWIFLLVMVSFELMTIAWDEVIQRIESRLTRSKHTRFDS